MSANPSVILIDSKLGPIYEKLVQERGTSPPTEFEIENMKEAIIAEKQKLLQERNEKIKELEDARQAQQDAKREFHYKLNGPRQRSATQCLNYSRELTAQSNDLSKNFTHIADKIDNASAILNRARAVDLYIGDIQVYARLNTLTDVLKDMTYLRHHENDSISKIAETVAKLIKIVTIASKQVDLENGVKNLNDHRDHLIAELTRLIGETEDPHKLHDYLHAEMLLQSDEVVLNHYLEGVSIFTSEEAIELQYKEEYLSEGNRKLQQRYENLCNYISQECHKLFPNFDIIFDRPMQAKHALLMNVCHKILSVFVEGVLQYARIQDNFCKMLMMLYETTSDMLKSLFEKQAQPFAAANSTYLDKIFITYQREYGEIEITNLKMYLASRVEPALEKLEQVYKQTNLLNLFKKTEETINPFDIFNDEIPHELLSSAKEALVRCFYLSPPEELSPHFNELMSSFFENTFNKYLISVVSACSFYLSKIDKPELIGEYISRFIKLVTLVNSNVLSLEEAYKNTLKAIMQPLSGVHTSFIRFKSQLIETLENETIKGLNNCLTLALSHSKKILSSKQKKSDFLPGQSTSPFSSGPSSAPKFLDRLTSKNKLSPPPPDMANVNPEKSEACSELSDFIRPIIVDVNLELDGENRVSFLSELGRILIKEVIFDHLCQYRYNFAGARQLLVDVAEYQSVIDTFKIDSLSKQMMDFATASLWMTTDAQALPDLIRSQTQTKRSMRLAKILLPLRVDAKEIDMDAIFH